MQRSKLKLQNESKEDSKKPADAATPGQNKYDMDHIRVLNSSSHNRELKKIICDISKQKDGIKNDDNKTNNDNDSDDNDDDDDDNFDNGMSNISISFIYHLSC